jgi:hypothetical protein
MPERKPARKNASGARRAKPATPTTHDADARTVAQIRREAERAGAVAPVAHDLPPKASLAELGAVELQELKGGWTTLGALWADSPTAIVFLRHYG